jgi:mRNA interferase MazF
MTRGDIVLTPFPFTNLSQYKIRPALLLHIGNQDCVLAFITTTSPSSKYSVKLSQTQGNGLKATSYVVMEKIATLNKQLLLGRIGSISSADTKKVRNHLKSLFQL